MSVPNTMRVGPFTPTVLVKKRYLIFYFFLIWASIIPILLEFWIYWQLLWSYTRPVHFYTYLPLLIFLMYITIVFSAIFFAKILLLIVNVIHKPREGTFLRVPADRDYRYWSLRNTIKRWPVWLAHRFPFPGILDNICFKAFGVKTKISNSLFEGWVDTEFIDFGKDVVVGQGAIVQSAVIIGNLLIVRKTVIDDDVRIGSHAIVMPGTHIGHNCILAANSVTTVGQVLEEGWIYVGIPAKKFKRNYFFEDGLEDKLGHVEDIESLREKYEEIYTKRYDELKQKERKERKEIKREKKEEEKRRFVTEDIEDDDGFNI
ncbi:MAG: DapH/DapD/GlmU-related protein [Promethearchaeota archaeon]|jgi:acetyltransferase-like isoleucine patch superfamily enzyme